MTGTPAYFAVKLGLRFSHAVSNVSNYELLDKDVVLLPSRSQAQEKPLLFSLSFDIDAPADTFLLAYVRLTDCFDTETFQTLVKSDPPRQKPTSPLLIQTPKDINIMLIDTQGLHTPLPFLLLSIFLGSLYLVLFAAFLLLCLCKPKRRQFIVPAMLFQGTAAMHSRTSTLSSAFGEAGKSSTSALVAGEPSPYSSPAHDNLTGLLHTSRRLPITESIPLSRKILIFLYVCFRAFTIFLFTFSVGLSVILSIESDSFKTLISCVQNAKGDRIRELASQEAIRKTLSMHAGRTTTSPWLQELRQIERASDAELSRQVRSQFSFS